MSLPEIYSTIAGVPVVWDEAYWSPIEGQENYSRDRCTGDLFIVHDIEGSAGSARGVFKQPGRQGSTQLIADPQNGRFIQMVRSNHTAYGVGNYPYNLRGFQIELPGYSGQQYSDAVIDYCARAVAQWSIDTGGPIRKLTRAEVLAGARGVTAHEDIPHPSIPGRWGGKDGHTDPGPTFPWDQMLSRARDYAAKGGAAPADGLPTFPVAAARWPTGFSIDPEFAADWLTVSGAVVPGRVAVAIALNGYPISGLITRPDGYKLQYFERARLEVSPAGVRSRGLVGAELWAKGGR